MVETKALFNKGTSTGVIDKDAIIVGVPNGWRLMQAQPTTSKQAYAIIFWEPSSVEDCEPRWWVYLFYFIYCDCMLSFQVGACIHDVEHMSPIFADSTSDHIHIQYASAVHNLK
jgi:hypothetical protein